MKIKLLAPIFAGLFLMAAAPARGSIAVTLVESGSDLVLSYSGSFDLNATLSFSDNGSLGVAGGMIVPNMAAFLIGEGGASVSTYNVSLTGPSSLSSSEDMLTASSSSGSGFGLVAAYSNLSLPLGYVSGSAISGTATFSSVTLASLDLVAGTYTWEFTNGSYSDTVVMTIGAVPEPAQTAAILGAVGIAGVLARRRMRRA